MNLFRSVLEYRKGLVKPGVGPLKLVYQFFNVWFNPGMCGEIKSPAGVCDECQKPRHMSVMVLPQGFRPPNILFMWYCSCEVVWWPEPPPIPSELVKRMVNPTAVARILWQHNKGVENSWPWRKRG